MGCIGDDGGGGGPNPNDEIVVSDAALRVLIRATSHIPAASVEHRTACCAWHATTGLLLEHLKLLASPEFVCLPQWEPLAGPICKVCGAVNGLGGGNVCSICDGLIDGAIDAGGKNDYQSKYNSVFSIY